MQKVILKNAINRYDVERNSYMYDGKMESNGIVTFFNLSNSVNNKKFEKIQITINNQFEENGYFYGSFEAVKTDPFLYLRYKDNENTVEKDTYGIDYVVGYSDFSSGLVDEYFLGYTFGGDALVFNAKAGWTNLKNFSIIGNLFYMMHGTFDKWTKWSPIGNGTNPDCPKYDLFNFLTNSYPEQIYNNKDNEGAHSRNAISHTFDFGVKVNYSINENVKVFAQNDFIFVNNYGNHAGEKRFDYQLVLGAKFNFSL